MTREDVLASIAAHRAELRDLGVQELSLFGSVARGDEGPESDLDFVVQFERNTFDCYMALKEMLESIFGRDVDLVLKSAIKPRLREAILRECVRAA